MQARNAGNKEIIRRGPLMKMLDVSAQTLPLFVSKLNERIPPLCGAIPAESSYIAKPGDMVAALVKSLADEEENWILAEVVTFIPQQNKYEVDDIDEEQKDRHILSKCRVVPLPLMRTNPETDGTALFPKGTMGTKFWHQLHIYLVLTYIPYRHVFSQRPVSANHLFLQGYRSPTAPDLYRGLQAHVRGRRLC